MIVSWLLRALPGPAWLRAALLLVLTVLLGWLLWEWGFPWLVQHFSSALEGDPTMSRRT